MGVMKEQQMTRAFIAELYKALAEDTDVERLHLYEEILRAAEAVLEASPAAPMPYSVDLIALALRGASADLEDKRHVWREQDVR
jgi:hypothetical protein